MQKIRSLGVAMADEKASSLLAVVLDCDAESWQRCGDRMKFVEGVGGAGAA
jgi:hypothetical protein